MGKGGAPTTTQTTQNQNVAYTPTGLQGFQDIYNRASGVASQPYQPYGGQLVQGLTPTQTGAISDISGIASQPLQASQIQQYMNPFQSNVIDATMANINETNRQQMADTTGKLTQSAGGVGASRIALGQGELARQQSLASNQTLAGLQQQNYSQALGTAQQQQGFGLGAAQAQLGAGGLEQQTGQAGLTAQYQQYLQQLAFPYQQAQFLAGIGLPSLGAMGGQQFQTGAANQTMTPPGMSWLQGLAGLGAIGAGAAGGFGNSGTGGVGGTEGKAAFLPNSARGGRIYPHHFADGGSADDQDPGKTITLGPDDFSRQEDEALAPVLGKSGYVPDASSPKADEKMPTPMAPMPSAMPSGGGSSSGSSFLGDLASIGKTVATIIPFLKHGGAVGYDDGGTVPQQGPGMGAYPTPAMMGSPLTRGALPQQADLQSPNVFYGKPLPNMLPPSPVAGQSANQNMYEAARQALQQQQLGQALASLRNRASSQDDSVSVSAREYARGGQAVYPESDVGSDRSNLWNRHRDNIDHGYDAMDRMLRGQGDGIPIRPGTRVMDPQGMGRDVRHLADGGDAGDFDQGYDPEMWQPGNTAAANPYASAVDMTGPLSATASHMVPPSDSDSIVAPSRAKLAAGLTARATPQESPVPTDVSAAPRAAPYPTPRDVGQFDPATARPSEIMNLDNYKSQVATRPTVRGLASNPDFWMRAGLNILAANPAKGPLGAIASGAAGTVGNYDQWSKEDLSSKQKAQELAGKLMEHANKYTKLTANEKAHLGIEHERLQQGKWQAFNYQDESGQMKAGFMDTKTRQIVDAEGHPVNPARIYGRSSQQHPTEKTMTDKDLLAAVPGSTIDDLPRLREQYQRGLQSKSPGSQSSPLPDPGAGKRTKGVWYIGPSGQPQQWLGE